MCALFFFFFNDTATTEIYTLSLHDALPIFAVIERLTNEEGITAFEVNASCPNTSAGGLEFGAEPRGLAELVRASRRASTRPLSVKLSPVLPDIPAMARDARAEGADAVTLVHTMPGLLDKRLGHGSGRLSPASLLLIRLL